MNLSSERGGNRVEFKVGLIGMGKRMRWFVRELRKINGIQIVAICDVIPEAVAAFGDELGIDPGKRYNDHTRLIQDEDVQVVISVTPNHVHGEIVRSCLLAQKPLITEKPFTRTFEEAVDLMRLFSAQEGNPALCMIGFTKRYFPGLRYAREMVRSGKLGTIRHASLKYFQGWGSAVYQTPINWRLQKEFTGTGTLADLGAHIIDAARFLFGEFVEVSGRMHTIVERRKDNKTGEMVPVEVDDFVSFEALLEGGAAGVFQSTRNALGEKDVIEIQIYGDEGTIYFRNSAMDELVWVRNNADGQDVIRETIAAPVGCRYGEVEDFFDRLRGLERDGFPGLVDGYLNQEVIEAIIRASAERRTVTIREVRPEGLRIPPANSELRHSESGSL
jgi:predicted dehydrogenase